MTTLCALLLFKPTISSSLDDVHTLCPLTFSFRSSAPARKLLLFLLLLPAAAWITPLSMALTSPPGGFFLLFFFLPNCLFNQATPHQCNIDCLPVVCSALSGLERSMMVVNMNDFVLRFSIHSSSSIFRSEEQRNNMAAAGCFEL